MSEERTNSQETSRFPRVDGRTDSQPRRLVFALLSALIPGAGQIVAGYRWRGTMMVLASAAIAAGSLYFYQQGTSAILSYLVQPEILIGLFVINALVLLFRLGAILDAYRKPARKNARRPGGWRTALIGLALAAMLTVTAAPHAVLGYYTYLSHDLITDVFSSELAVYDSPTPTPEASPTPEPTATPEPTPTPEPTATPFPTPEPGNTPEPTPTPEPSPTPEPTPTPEPSPTPEPTPTPQPSPTPEPEFAGTDWMERGRLTVLLTGTDAGPGRTGARTDVIMVASLNLETGQSVLFSIPRNFGDIPLPDHLAEAMGTSEYDGMINSLYSHAQQFPEIAPEGQDPGLVALKGAASELLGIHIDYYAMVDMAGFVGMIDAFGGVTVNVDEPLNVRMSPPHEGGEWQVYDIGRGEQDLNGLEALAYARSRTESSDYDRMRRQRCLVASLAEETDVPTLLQVFPDVVEAIRHHVHTDIPLEMLPDMVMLRETIRMDQVVSIGFVPPDFHAGESSEGHKRPNYSLILETVQRALENPDQYLDEDGESDLMIGDPC